MSVMIKYNGKNHSESNYYPSLPQSFFRPSIVPPFPFLLFHLLIEVPRYRSHVLVDGHVRTSLLRPRTVRCAGKSLTFILSLDLVHFWGETLTSVHHSPTKDQGSKHEIFRCLGTGYVQFSLFSLLHTRNLDPLRPCRGPSSLYRPRSGPNGEERGLVV